MFHRTLALAATCLTVAGAPAMAGVPDSEAIGTTVYASGFASPLEFVQNPVNDGIQYVLQQGGAIRVIQNGSVLATNFMQLTGISTGGERGLLGMALDPDFANNRRFYLDYTNSAGNTVIARFTMANNMLTAPTSSQEILMTIAQPFSNHNGGCLRLGPDGYLYIAMGDGGSGGDPFGNGQDKNTLLGKLLRIDVSPNTGFAIPADNPFVGVAGARDEVWAYGLRNTWKYTFDEGPCGTNGIFLADVGQNAREEINYEPAGVAGGRNYGWNCREGLASFSGCTPPAGESFTDPIFDYTHSVGFSITGGYMYRGAEMVHNRGRYFFADFVTNRLWSLAIDFDTMSGEATASDLIQHSIPGISSIAGFGRDADGELYILSFNGNIYRINGTVTPGDTNSDSVVNGSDLATLLAAWGSNDCGVADLNNDEMVNGADLAALLAAWGN